MESLQSILQNCCNLAKIQQKQRKRGHSGRDNYFRQLEFSVNYILFRCPELYLQISEKEILMQL